MDPHAARISRRYVLRLVGGAVLALSAALERRGAGAGRTWCRTDPVVTLDGYYASVYVSARAGEREFNNSTGDFWIEHPRGVVPAKVWEDPNGYFGHGISTSFTANGQLRSVKGAMEVRISCYVPASRDGTRILLEWAPGPVEWNDDGSPRRNPVQVSAQGYGNTVITVRGTLPYRLSNGRLRAQPIED